MPVYNGEKYLEQAINSILNQTFKDFEFIIINDCSKDNTEKIIMSYSDDRIVYVKNDTNLGVAATLNRGLEIAKGEYIARMDADDYSMPNRFEKQIEYMDSHKDVGLCGSNIIRFGDSLEENNFKYSQNDNQIRVDMVFNCAFAHPATMLRRHILTDHNLKYDIEYEKAEDYKLWYDILSVSKGHNLQIPLIKYRIHSNQVTKVFTQESNFSAEKIRKIMYNSICPHTDKYYNVFVKICCGCRDLNEDDYKLYIDFSKYVIKFSENIDKKVLTNVLSGINYTIYKNCKPTEYKILSIREILLIIRSFL